MAASSRLERRTAPPIDKPTRSIRMIYEPVALRSTGKQMETGGEERQSLFTLIQAKTLKRCSLPNA